MKGLRINDIEMKKVKVEDLKSKLAKNYKLVNVHFNEESIDHFTVLALHVLMKIQVKHVNH